MLFIKSNKASFRNKIMGINLKLNSQKWVSQEIDLNFSFICFKLFYYIMNQ